MSQRRAGDLIASKVTVGARPVTVTFQVTDRCNYRCSHCYQEHTEREELSFADVDRILGELADLGVLFLTLMGGEFFMRRDADDILRAAHRHGFAIKLLSTGHHITERRADLIADMRPIQVDMSLYGAHPHLHEFITRQPGSFKRTVEAAKRLIRRGVPVLLKAPAMESNAPELASFVELCRQLGAQSTMDAKITSMENADQQPVELRMSWRTLKDFYRNEGTGVAGYLTSTYSDHDPGKELRPLDHVPCGAGIKTLAINPQGEVWPCNSLPIKVGDLTRQSVREVWEGSDSLAEIKDLRWAKISECNVCQLRNYCQRCHAMALLEQGKMRGPSLEACRHAVVVRDSLRERGLIPATDTALPPTWDRVDPDGLHHRRAVAKRGGVRAAGLRVLQ